MSAGAFRSKTAMETSSCALPILPRTTLTLPMRPRELLSHCPPELLSKSAQTPIPARLKRNSPIPLSRKQAEAATTAIRAWKAKSAAAAKDQPEDQLRFHRASQDHIVPEGSLPLREPLQRLIEIRIRNRGALRIQNDARPVRSQRGNRKRH